MSAMDRAQLEQLDANDLHYLSKLIRRQRRLRIGRRCGRAVRIQAEAFECGHLIVPSLRG